MGKVGILTEKPSAARNFAAALGGMSGTFDGTDYVIVNARGHLLELKDPAMPSRTLTRMAVAVARRGPLLGESVLAHVDAQPCRIPAAPRSQATR